MKKRVAIQISGYIRTFHDCFDSWLNILSDEYEYDFFVHTYTNHGYSNGFNVDDITNDISVDVDLLKSRINIKKIILEEQFNNSGSIILSGHTDNRVKLMFRKIYLCNQLCNDYIIETNTKYEFIIRLRPDLFFEEKVIFTQPLENSIIVNKFTWGNSCVSNMYNDQIAICHPSVIDTYANLYTKIDSISNLHPESALFNYINSCNIDVKFLEIKMNIVR